MALASPRAFLGLLSIGQTLSKIGSTLWAKSWAQEIMRWVSSRVGLLFLPFVTNTTGESQLC